MCFSELCQKGPETSENLRLQEIVTTYREPSAGQLVVVVVDGGTESEPPHTGPGGWVQETAVSANGHQQITEDQQTQHHVIHIATKKKNVLTKSFWLENSESIFFLIYVRIFHGITYIGSF